MEWNDKFRLKKNNLVLIHGGLRFLVEDVADDLSDHGDSGRPSNDFDLVHFLGLEKVNFKTWKI